MKSTTSINNAIKDSAPIVREELSSNICFDWELGEPKSTELALKNSTYIAYVSQQNLLHDENLDPCSHPQINSIFDGLKDGKYVLKESNLQ